MLGIPKRSRSSKKLARHTPSFLIPNSARNMTRTVPWLAEAHALPRDPAEAVVARASKTSLAECAAVAGPPAAAGGAFPPVGSAHLKTCFPACSGEAASALRAAHGRGGT